MFAGVSYYKNRSHHGLYNFHPLCHNAPMSTLCRAGPKWRKYGGADLPTVAALSAIAAAATADAAKVGTSEKPFFCPIHLSASQKCRVKRFVIFRIIRKFSEIFQQNGAFPKKFRIYFLEKGRRLGQIQSKWACRAVAPKAFGAKAGQTDAARQPGRQIVCNYFKMNILQPKSGQPRSKPVKVNQTKSQGNVGNVP